MTTRARIGFATALALALTLGTAAAVRAATLTITSDKSTYGIGETVSLTVVGDSQGASDIYIFGTLLYPTALLSPNGDNAQNTLTSFGGVVFWVAGSLPVDDPGYSQPPGVGDPIVFNQIGATEPFPVDQSLVATLSFTATGAGVADLSWLTNAGFASENLHFFGLTDAPGASVTIVPEPGTAALLIFGLVGLAARRRVLSFRTPVRPQAGQETRNPLGAGWSS